MTTGDWAFVISICSFGVAVGSFVWNVWSKFIYPKARIRVSLQALVIFHPGQDDHQKELISLSATNMGPGEVTLSGAVIRNRKVEWRKHWKAYFDRRYRYDYGLLNPLQDFPAKLDHSIGPFSGGLPKKLAVGETFSSYFPRRVDWFENKVAGVGFGDSLGRNHWCARSDVQKVREKVTSKNARPDST